MWLMCLPIAIWEVYGWTSPIVAAALAFFLLGIENIGAHRLTWIYMHPVA